MPIISLDQCTAKVSNNLYSTYREAKNVANASPISLIWAPVTAGVSAVVVGVVIQSIEDAAINNIYVHAAAISLVTCLSFLAVYMIGKKKINTAQWVVSEADARHSRAKREAQEEQRRAQEEQRQAEAFKQAAVERQSLSGIAAAQQQSATSSAPSTEAVTPHLTTLFEIAPETAVVTRKPTFLLKEVVDNYNQLFEKVLKPFFNDFDALVSLMKPKTKNSENWREQREALFTKTLTNWAAHIAKLGEVKKDSAEYAVRSIIEALQEKVDAVVFEKVAHQATFYAKLPKLSGVKAAIAEYNALNSDSVKSPVKAKLNINIAEDATITQEEAENLMEDFRQDLGLFFDAFGTLYSKMKAKDKKKPEQITQLFTEMQNLLAEYKKKLHGVQSDSTEFGILSLMTELHNRMASILINAHDHQEHLAKVSQGKATSTTEEKRQLLTKKISEAHLPTTSPDTKDYVVPVGGISSRAKLFGSVVVKPSLSNSTD